MSERPKDRQIPGTPGRRNDGDALDASGNVDREKLKQNQSRLQVGADHKTDAMKKGRRGGFP